MTAANEAEPSTRSSSSEPESRGTWGSSLGIPLVMAAVAATVFVAMTIAVVRQSLDPATANHDVGWTLYAGEKLLDGAEYGVEIVELNPPLILWVAGALAALARLLGTPVLLLYNLLVLLLIASFSFTLWRLLLRAFTRPEVPAAIASLMAAALLFIPSYEYGQRDQLIFLLATPHLLLSALSVTGSADFRRGARILAGAAMGAALCMKPHFAAAWLGVELAMLIRARTPSFLSRPENWTVVCVGLFYVAYLVALGPRYFEVMQDAIAVYGAYDLPVAILSKRSALMFGCLALMLAVRPRGAAGRCAVVSFIASLAGFAAVLAQHKTYPYHYLPCQLSALLGIACTLGAPVQEALTSPRPRARAGASLALAAALMIALAMTAIPLVHGVDRVYPVRRKLVSTIELHGRGEPVLFFSSSVNPAFPVLTITGNRSASPYSCLWKIAGNYSPAELSMPEFPYRTLEEMDELERGFVATVVDHMERDRPRLLFFDHRRFKQAFRSSPFLFERYFRADPRFEVLLRRYRPLGMVGGHLALVREEGDGKSPDSIQY